MWVAEDRMVRPNLAAPKVRPPPRKIRYAVTVEPKVRHAGPRGTMLAKIRQPAGAATAPTPAASPSAMGALVGAWGALYGCQLRLNLPSCFEHQLARVVGLHKELSPVWQRIRARMLCNAACKRMRG